MTRSFIKRASIAALIAFAMSAHGAVAAETGHGCDVKAPGGCEPGDRQVQPTTKFPTAPESVHDSNQSGRDPQHHRSDPPAPPSVNLK
jgi:hypothetical protein